MSKGIIYILILSQRKNNIDNRLKVDELVMKSACTKRLQCIALHGGWPTIKKFGIKGRIFALVY
jgi:hypothetical protein